MEMIRQTHASKHSVIAWTILAGAPGAAAVGGWLGVAFMESFVAWFAFESTAILLLLVSFVGRKRLKRHATEGQEALYVVSTLLSLPAAIVMLVSAYYAASTW